MAAKTNEQLTIELQLLKTQVTTLQSMIAELKQDVNSRVRLSDLARSMQNLDDQIKDNAALISTMEQKLAKISLPDNSRYYLESTEVSDFRSNFNKLLAMMSSFEQLYKNLVAYSVNNVTGS